MLSTPSPAHNSSMPLHAGAAVHNASCLYVLVLNWNGWRVTLRCLESLLRSTAPLPMRVLVWDNGSSDGSAEKIRAWAAGELAADAQVPEALHDCVSPPLPKPVPLQIVDENETTALSAPLVLVRGARNLGYAGGNNAALRLALAQPDCTLLWILNNDVIVDRNCPAALCAAHAADDHDRPIGTAIYDFDVPAQVQAWAGQRLGRGWLVAPRHARPGERLDFLIGASLFLSSARARQLGFFNEDYFLNAEDLEYTYAYGRAFRRTHPGEEPFLVAGRIWHQESATQSQRRERQAYYFTRNLLYAARHIGWAQAFTTFCYGCARIAWNVLRGRRAVARGTARGLLHYLRGVKGPLPA